jgi:hypothetical protein
MCTGPRASVCPEETLAWQLYDEHGYRPRELRPCLTAPGSAVTPRPRPQHARHQRLRSLLVRLAARASSGPVRG